MIWSLCYWIVIAGPLGAAEAPLPKIRLLAAELKMPPGSETPFELL